MAFEAWNAQQIEVIKNNVERSDLEIAQKIFKEFGIFRSVRSIEMYRRKLELPESKKFVSDFEAREWSSNAPEGSMSRPKNWTLEQERVLVDHGRLGVKVVQKVLKDTFKVERTEAAIRARCEKLSVPFYSEPAPKELRLTKIHVMFLESLLESLEPEDVVFAFNAKYRGENHIRLKDLTKYLLLRGKLEPNIRGEVLVPVA